MELDSIIYNFFGMSIEKQIELMNEIINSMQQNNKKTNHNYHNLFDNYYNKITFLVNNKELYNKLNSNKRRLLRYKALKYFEEIVLMSLSHESDLSMQKRYSYLHSSDYYLGYYINEFNSYFHPKKISNIDSEKYIENFKNMDIDDKYNVIKKYIFHYTNLNEFFKSYIPNPQEIINNYNNIILNIIGTELFEYYKNFEPQDKVSIITNIADLINQIELRDEKTLIIKDKDAVKKQKALTIDKYQTFI